MNVKTSFAKVVALIMTILMLIPTVVINGFADTISTQNAKQFTDVKGHWAENDINDWAQKGLISGYNDDTFKPDNPITRAEFVTLLNKGLNLTQTTDINFKDVKSSDWFYKDLQIAKAANLIDGYGDSTFRPNDPITREEAAAIVAKLLNLQRSNQDVLKSFKDSSQISDWSRSSLNALVANGLLSGYQDNTIKPQRYITRAETIVLLNRALNLQSKQTSVVYDKAGIYGPETGTNTINNNVVISVPDVTLQNTVINGNLLIDKAVGDGNVTLKNVTVNGTVTVNGGGENSVVFDNCSLGKVVVNKEDGKVRIVAHGTTKIDSVELQSGAKLEDNTAEESFSNVTIDSAMAANTNIVLSGNFSNVNLNASNVIVNLISGTVANLSVNDKANGSKIDISNGAEITTLNINTAISVTGTGIIKTANINSNGVIIEEKPSNINIASGLTATISGQIVNKSTTLGASIPPVTSTRPATPTKLSVTSSVYNSVRLSWAAVTGATGYNVYRSTTSGGPYAKLNTSYITSTSYTDTSVAADITYYYVVSAVNQYGESDKSAEVSVTVPTAPTPPVAPTGLDISSSTADSISLSWAAVSGAESYNIYRSVSRFGTYKKINTVPVTSTSYTDAGLDNTDYYYKVSAVNENGESDLSAPISLEIKLFGSNVYVFAQTDSADDIQATVTNIFAEQETAQFGSGRYALFFKPGSYNVNIPIGFYTSVYGLGQTPDDVTITGSVRSEADWMGGNATCNFWRSVENLTDVPKYSASPVAPSGTETWAASQAAPLRRVHIKGNLTLWDPNPNNYDGSWSSGGFIADSVIDGTISSGSQQQYFTRSSKMSSWSGSNWNMVFVGDVNAPVDTSYPTPAYTTVDQAPVVREKPFLYIDSTGKYYVFVPDVRENAKGVSWTNNEIGPGTSLSLDKFYIAHPETDTASSINEALRQGKNILFTPGIYHLSEAINVTNPNTIILGIGLATLIPDNGTAAMKVADVDGVEIAGILFDAGANNSPVLLEVGPSGNSADHSANPTTLSDLFFRVGGAEIGKADACLIINSNNVIGDDLWVWRADHGDGVGWNQNTSKNGMIVNGNNVTMYGLFVEHFQEYQTLWNGNGGRTYFYQSEMPYDVPSQNSWMSHDGTVNGYASYKVADSVTSHEIWGSGVYSNFTDADVKANSGVEVPDNLGVKVHHATSVFLSGYGGITHVVNNTGNAAVRGNMRQTVTEYCDNVAQPVIMPATGTYAGAQEVTITCDTPGATIRYTTDGSTPTATSGIIYEGPFTISSTATIKAIAYKTGMNDSAVTSTTITITNSIAYKKTAEASSYNGTNIPANAFDGDITTRWESAQGVDPQWITVDLGQSYSVTGVKIVWETAAGKDYKIQVSDDNSTWTDVYTVTGGESGAILDVTFPAVTGRYVRMYGTARTTEYGYSIYEFEVYGTPVS